MTIQNWKKMDISPKISFIKGKAPKTLINNPEPGYILYLTPELLRGNSPSIEYCSEKESISVSNNEVIILWDGSNAGEIFKAKTGALASTMARINIQSLAIDSSYLFYFLKNYEYRIKNQVRGSGIPHVDRKVFSELPDDFPLNLSEQRKIAEILNTVDDTIEQTEALIRKYQRIKQGLMQDLLTRGVDENGELRCEKNNHFKDSEIGHIPYEWEVTNFEHLVNNITARWIPRNTGVSFPCLNLENIESETGHVNGFSDAIENASTKTVFLKGDILFGKLRPYLKKYWIADVDGVCTTEILVFRAQRSIDHRYIYYLVQNEKFINYTISSSFGTKMPRTSWEIIKRYKIGKPDFEEQKRISKILFSIDSQIETSRIELSKLNSLKQGLMQDLLTGKVRVNALLE